MVFFTTLQVTMVTSSAMMHVFKPTLVSGGASLQGLEVVPQQFSWKCDEKQIIYAVFVN